MMTLPLETTEDQNEDMIEDLSQVWLYSLFLILSLQWWEYLRVWLGKKHLTTDVKPIFKSGANGF